MTETAIPLGPNTVQPDADPSMTPCGLQSRAVLRNRRILAAVLNIGTVALLGWGVGTVFGGDGWSWTDIVIMVSFFIGTPWTVMGLWNALLGLWLLHFHKDGLRAAAPHVFNDEGPITERTALLMFLRNEEPDRALARVLETKQSLDATGDGDKFDVFILSDTSLPEIAALEEEAFARIRPLLGPNATYRRREKNTAWKAGNVRDFLAVFFSRRR